MQRVMDQNRKPALRFDKVATGLVERVRRAVEPSVPDGKTLVFTVTAPIRQPSKTSAELEERILNALARRPERLEIEDEIHGNRVWIMLVACTKGDSTTIGIVHNPGPTQEALLAAALATLPVRVRGR